MYISVAEKICCDAYWEDETLRPNLRHNLKYEEQLDGCHVYTALNSSETQPCRNGWTYDLKHGEKNIISEVIA